MGKGHPSGNRRGVRQNLLNKKFGKWFVKEKAPKRPPSRQTYWYCVCDCGNVGEVTTSTLVKGQSISCGCSISENNKSKEERRVYQAVWAKQKRLKSPARSANNKINCECKRVTPSWLTDDDWNKMDEIYFKAKHLTKATGIRHEVDHKIPLQGELVSGLHVPDNLQIITKSENSGKQNKFLAKHKRYAELIGDNEK